MGSLLVNKESYMVKPSSSQPAPGPWILNITSVTPEAYPKTEIFQGTLNVEGPFHGVRDQQTAIAG